MFSHLHRLEINARTFNVQVFEHLTPTLTHLRVSTFQFVDDQNNLLERVYIRNPRGLEMLTIESYSGNGQLEQPLQFDNNFESLRTFVLISYKLTDKNLNFLSCLPRTIQHVEIQELNTTSIRLNQMLLLSHKENLVNLTYLGLKLNNSTKKSDIVSIPSNWFVGLSNLKCLVLSGSQIREIESNSFEHLHNLDTLDLSFTGLCVLKENYFFGLKNLTKLNLSFCKIRHVDPKCFHHVPKLCELDLHSNKIANLSVHTLAKQQDLHSLNLENNPLRTLPMNFIEKLQNLRYLNIGGFGTQSIASY